MTTLQALLNCLDGHTCVEGTLLFMTANNPEKMDYAMIRSCRIDYKLELGMPINIKSSVFMIHSYLNKVKISKIL